ncbi:MAG: penicillin acylase family protein, partial [Alphaproteobacteria bacterium]
TRLRAWSALDLSLLDLVAGLPIDAGMDGAAWASDGPGGCELGAVLRASPALLPALYDAVVETPTLRVAGCAPLGVPAFLVGRTRDLAWAGLPAIVDDCDVVMEELDGIGNRRTPAGWEKLASRRETIRVRDAEPVVVEVLETRRGPLVSHLARQFAGLAADPRVPALALHWGAGTVFSSAAAWAGIAHASDVASAGRAAAAFEHSTQPVRLVVADRAGRVAAGTFGSLPVREAACRLPMLGWKGEGGWTGVRPASVPGDAWSQAGPGHGVASASEAPPTVRAVEDARAARPTETRFGEAAPGFDAADPLLREILPVLRDALARSGDAAPSDLATELASFDGSLRAEDHATAVVLAAVHHFLPSELFPVAAFGPLVAFPRVAAPAVGRILLAPSSPWFDDAAARDRVVAAALVRAAAWLSHAEATTGRRACEALLRSPEADAAGVEAGESAVVPPLGAAGSSAAVDWRGPSPPFLVGLAPTLRAGCRLAESTLRRATRAELAGATMAVPPPSRAPESSSGDFHSIDLAGPAGGEILDLVAGS